MHNKQQEAVRRRKNRNIKEEIRQAEIEANQAARRIDVAKNALLRANERLAMLFSMAIERTEHENHKAQD